MVDGAGQDRTLPPLRFVFQRTKDGSKIQVCLFDDNERAEWNRDGLVAATAIERETFMDSLDKILSGLEEGVWYGAATMADIQAYHETGELPPGY